MAEERGKHPLDDEALETVIGGSGGATTLNLVRSTPEMSYLPYLPGVDLPRPEDVISPGHAGLVHTGSVEDPQYAAPAESSGSVQASPGLNSLNIIRSVRSSLL